MASFIGIVLDLPTIGITKNVLCGDGELPGEVGMATLLLYNGEQVGHLLKSKDGCRPIVIAPGHRVSMQSSLELACNILSIASFLSLADWPISLPIRLR